MKIKDITQVIEDFAPLDLQAGFDNCGLLVGGPEKEVSAAMMCVDITEGVLNEAIERGAGLIVAHHPVIFNPLRHITGSTYIERVVEQAIKNDIALYAAHTNLDCAPGGISVLLATMFGLQQQEILAPTSEGAGFGIFGVLPQATDTLAFLREVKSKLGLKALRHSDIVYPEILRVAVSSGSGASQIEAARSRGADIYLAAEFKHNHFLDAVDGPVIADIGHFESEYCAIELLCDVITKKIPNFVVFRSNSSVNPVNYLI